MAEARTLQVDLASLLQPISPLMPAGESLRRSSVYDQIKEARREDEAGLEQGVWKSAQKRADWAEVARICLDSLKNKSKDLRLVAWLCEAWLKLYGPTGCEQGLRLMESIVNRFWDTAYPPIESGDLDGRMAPIGWVNEKLAVQLKLVPMIRPNTKEPEVYTWMDWEKASLHERQGNRGGAEELTTTQFMTCVLLTPASFYVQLERELGGLSEAASDVEKAIDKRCGRPMSALWQFKEVLQAMREFATRALDQKAEEEPRAEEDTAGAAPNSERADEDAGGTGLRWGPIRNRAEAYQRLAEAADYLMRKEPHSPTPHLVRRAVTWGQMSFTELIQELVRDQGDLASIYGLLGIGMPGERGEGGR